MCGLFLTGPESRSVFEEARSLEVLTPVEGFIPSLKKNSELKSCAQVINEGSYPHICTAVWEGTHMTL